MIRSKKRKEKLSVRLVNHMLLVMLLVVFISGILLHPFQGVLIIKMVHKLSSVLLVVGVIVHVMQHRAPKRERVEGHCKEKEGIKAYE